MSTSKNLKLTTWLGGLLTPQFLSTALAVVVTAVLLPVGKSAAWGDDKGDNEGKADRGAVRLLKTIPVPGTLNNPTGGKLYSFDISWVDQRSRTYYLADRSNLAVDVVDTKTGKFVAQLQAGFAGVLPGAGTSGPNGVTTGGHCLFVTDAPSRVVSFNTSNSPPTFVNAVSTASGDPKRADELAFDPKDNVILAINNADTPPFGTFIKVNPSTCALTQPAVAPPGVATPDRLLLNAANGVDAQNGAEQPQWDHATRRFYLAIPQIGPTPSNGGVVRIDPTTHKIDHTFPISFCGPAGLSKGPDHDFLVGCNATFGNRRQHGGTARVYPECVHRRGSRGRWRRRWRRSLVQCGGRQLLHGIFREPVGTARQPSTYTTCSRRRPGRRGPWRHRRGGREPDSAGTDVQPTGGHHRCRAAPRHHRTFGCRRRQQQSHLRPAGREQRLPQLLNWLYRCVL